MPDGKVAFIGGINESNSLRGVERDTALANRRLVAFVSMSLIPSGELKVPLLQPGGDGLVRINESNSLRGVERRVHIEDVRAVEVEVSMSLIPSGELKGGKDFEQGLGFALYQ